MINNETELRVTKEQIVRFAHHLEKFPSSCPGVHPRILRASKESLESVLEDLRDEVRTWERRVKP